MTIDILEIHGKFVCKFTKDIDPTGKDSIWKCDDIFYQVSGDKVTEIANSVSIKK